MNLIFDLTRSAISETHGETLHESHGVRVSLAKREFRIARDSWRLDRSAVQIDTQETSEIIKNVLFLLH